MHAYEFDTILNHGKINIPEHFKSKDGQKVRVLILVEETNEEHSGGINHLLANPIDVIDATPITRDKLYE